MAEKPAVSGSTGGPAEEAAPSTQGIGWLLQPGSSSIGLYIEVAANADELTPEVIQGLEQLMTNAHRASVNRTLMNTCGALTKCGVNSGDCGRLTSCGKNM